MENTSIIIGRVLMGLYFFVPGIRKFTASDELVNYMQSNGIIFSPQLLWLAGAASVIGGILMMTGRYVKVVAYGFVIYVLLVNFLLHNFWAMSDEMIAREMQNFIKNLAIAAGLLILAGYAPLRRPSLRNCWQSDRAVSSD